MTQTTLYFSPQPTRSARARWALSEAGIPFASKPIDIFKGEHKSDDYLAVNPLGFVPAAVVDGTLMIESGAVALWAAMEAPDAGLLPSSASKEGRAALQWVLHGPAELDHRLGVLNAHTRFRPPAARNAELVAETEETLHRRLQLIANALEATGWLAGDRFSVADIVVGHSLVWAKMIEQLDSIPALDGYLRRLQARPHFQEVYGPEIHTFPDPHAA